MLRRRALLDEIETIWLDRGYDSATIREQLGAAGIDDAVIAKKRKPGEAQKTGPKRQPMGLRRPVERINSWLSNFGEPCRNNSRKAAHRLSELALAAAFLLTAKLIDRRNRWSLDVLPIR